MTTSDQAASASENTVDMSPEAIAARIAEVAGLLRVCLSLEEAGRALRDGATKEPIEEEANDLFASPGDTPRGDANLQPTGVTQVARASAAFARPAPGST